MTDLEAVLREIIPSCLTESNGRYYATQEGAARLESHLWANGFALKVSVTQDGRFDVHPVTD